MFNITSTDEALSHALLKLSRQQPFFSALAFYLNPEFSDAPGISTAGTAGFHLWLNPGFFSAQTLQERVGLLLHEVMHVAFEHVFRRGGRDPRRWNAACDFVVNQMIKDAGGEIPKGGCLDPQYAGLLEEEVYGRLPKSIEIRFPAKLYDLLENEPQASSGEGESQPSPHEIELLRQRARAALLQAALTARMMGALPAGIARYLDIIRQPEQDWRALLADYLTALEKGDYDWMRPSRRSAALGIVLPDIRRVAALEHAVIVVDTSGSIAQEELAYFIGEILGVVDLCFPRALTVLPCDAQVYAPISFDSIPDAETVMEALHSQEALRGGGGTDMPAALDWIDRAAFLYPPAVVLVMTDGYTDFGKARDYPVVWCITRDGPAPSWGHTVRIMQRDE
jgi:predicted metal-dependent peptidase